MDQYHWLRTSSKLIDVEWIKSAVQEINSGKSMRQIVKKARLTNVTFKEISQTMFKKLVRQNNLQLNTKPGRKTKEIDLNTCQAFANLKDMMPNAGINKIIEKMKTDINNIEKHPQEFKEMRLEIQKNGKVDFQKGNWLDQINRTTFVDVVSEVSGQPIEINPIFESIQTASYIEEPFKSPSYRMGRKIHEAIIDDSIEIEEEP
ncbi:hypothetical protein TVAG_484550 [Trichomonas vaginalis G3]|uniref:Uncharacterized protein n=1 Tax=Trichomonas vaginalis (strain ATCC PRA-98 / G3) TaxID=412133 RepID=A2F1Y3_TRIV3|nr:hypothetical protein TVAGG3_0128580 [Trichomonas vaginalis G3]EAY01081.1 hypothetical protein TVAG_484550 [Trichomonas vaginalis G3]KAI5545938.1 hypothetical protein TVAGG3_0128580 [Trichomonas vaginalis G3]|eukprot:XP_001330097.1 hypothetical protein [Trichomonas vaginalis G3]